MLALTFCSESNLSHERFQVLIGIDVGIIPDVHRNQTYLPLSFTPKLHWLSNLPLQLLEQNKELNQCVIRANRESAIEML